MILITEFMDDAAVAALRTSHEVIHEPDLADRSGDLPRAVTSAAALIVRNRTQVTADLLGHARRLRCVGRLGVGLDNIDVMACKGNNVAVLPATGANDLSVAEYVITTAMMLMRRAYAANAAVLAGSWPRQHCAGHEIHGKTIGLVGFGPIGQRVASLARALGMQALASDPYLPPDEPGWQLAGRRSLERLLAEADLVSLHVPLTPSTRNLIDAGRLAMMKPGSILINTSRGGIADEDAVADALRSGRLGGAALDVFETEPVSRASAGRLRDVPNLVLTPHIAGVTVESNYRVSMLIAEKVMAHLSECN